MDGEIWCRRPERRLPRRHHPDVLHLTESGPTFRTTPPGIPDIHANLSLGNLGFEEYAAWAGESPDGVYRSV